MIYQCEDQRTRSFSSESLEIRIAFRLHGKIFRRKLEPAKVPRVFSPKKLSANPPYRVAEIASYNETQYSGIQRSGVGKKTY